MNQAGLTQPGVDRPGVDRPGGMPTLDEVIGAAHVFRVPLRVPFRGVTEREGVLLHGPRGWGEFAPFVEYDDVESARWLAAAVEAAWSGWPQTVRLRVPVNATVPAVPPADVPAVLARFPGCTTAKVKVAQDGQALGDDLDRVAAVREALGPDGLIRVDANGAWSLEDAMDALTALAPYRLQYAEQPCASTQDLARLRVALVRAGVHVPVAADESVRKAPDPLAVAVAGAADVVVLKAAPLGGVQAGLQVARVLGAEHGIAVVVSSALDTSVGISAGLALAAALPDLPYACGLATAGLLVRDVVPEPLLAVGGELQVRDVAPTGPLLAACGPPPERQQWWLERLVRCWALLDS